MKNLLTAVVLMGAVVVFGGETYSLYNALTSAVADPNATTSVFSGAGGETWTIGMVRPADREAVTPFGVKLTDGNAASGGYSKDGGATVPAILVNATDAEQSTFLGVVPARAVCMHPDNKNGAYDYCVVIRLSVPQEGSYRVRVQASDIGGDSDQENGVYVELAAGGSTVAEAGVGGEGEAKSWEWESTAINLFAGDVVTLFLDPKNVFNNDSTVVGLDVERIGDIPGFSEAVVADLNALIADNLKSSSPSCDFTVGELRVVTGAFDGGGTPYDLTSLEKAAINCKGFGISGSIPWVLTNVGGPVDASAEGTTGVVGAGEIWMHPYATQANGTWCSFNYSMNAYVGVSAPSNGWYTAVGLFRDLCRGDAGSEENLGGAAVTIWTGTSGPERLVAADVVSAESDSVSREVRAESLWLNKGEMVCFAAGPNGSFGSDSTGLRARLLEGRPAESSEVLNVDLDGKQSSDEMPATFVGEVYYPGSGSFWNSVRGDDNDSSAGVVRLKTSAGRRTEISITMTREGDGGWDNYPQDGFNEMRDDYAYLVNAGTIDVVLSGLVPRGVYDLSVFSNNEDGTVVIGDIVHTVTRVSADVAGQNLYDILASAVAADGDGVLRFKLRTRAGGSGVSVYPGLGLRGVFPVRSGLVVIVK